MPTIDAATLFARCPPGPADACWIWNRAPNARGFVRLFINKSTWYAHRLSYQVFKGSVPPHAEVRHTCGVPACWNPAHLVLMPLAPKKPRNPNAKPSLHPRGGSLAEKFARGVKVNPDTGCHEWTGTLCHGYGIVRPPGEPPRRAHRLAYEMAKGPIPAGLVLDHLCRNPCCVNPDHLEPVTNAENVMRGEAVPARNARKTHCMRGHPLEGPNLYRDPSGRRRCRECKRLSEVEHIANALVHA